MNLKNSFSRRRFMTGAAFAIGYAGLRPTVPLWAQSAEPIVTSFSGGDFDAVAKLSFNENPYGPSESVLKAMQDAFKFANRYGYPDGGIVQAIATMHGVRSENILLGAGSTEILDLVACAFLPDRKKVVGVEPTFSSVYSFATGIKGSSIKMPLTTEYRQDIPALIKATKDNHKETGFVYICNPNNPTGNIVTKQEVKQLLDGIPQDVPVLMDEAYHHYVENADYATSVPYVIEGRPVIVARTFSKIYGLAGIRLGYAVAPRELIQKMSVYSSGFSVSAVAKWAGVASLKDSAAEQKVKKDTLALRKQTTAELDSLGYKSIPSEANFFMVNLKRPVRPVIEAFRARNVQVGRAFPPMMEHLRVSVGTAREMARFMTAFKEIMV